MHYQLTVEERAL